ncbi:MAG: hypothetical protein NZ521_01465 [Flammeovirgaceae bacterium]|nr:hypothetical protein [Flammeovirgaceae bacterium]MDW8286779.1 hypothetical protein [Flammeovirgaceae bacterium]
MLKERLRTFFKKPSSRLAAFRQIVWVQVLAFLNILLLKSFLEIAGVPLSKATLIADMLFLLITTAYIVYLYQLFLFFNSQRWLLNVIIVCLSIAFLIASISENPFYDVRLEENIHVCYSIGTSIIIYFTTLEIFQEEMSVIERLWGLADCMILSAFFIRMR